LLSRTAYRTKRTLEHFKAWSMNLGHENIATTLSAYCPVSPTNVR